MLVTWKLTNDAVIEGTLPRQWNTWIKKAVRCRENVVDHSKAEVKWNDELQVIDGMGERERNLQFPVGDNNIITRRSTRRAETFLAINKILRSVNNSNLF